MSGNAKERTKRELPTREMIAEDLARERRKRRGGGKVQILLKARVPGAYLLRSPGSLFFCPHNNPHSAGKSFASGSFFVLRKPSYKSRTSAVLPPK